MSTWWKIGGGDADPETKKVVDDMELEKRRAKLGLRDALDYLTWRRDHLVNALEQVELDNWGRHDR